MEIHNKTSDTIDHTHTHKQTYRFTQNPKIYSTRESRDLRFMNN